MERHNNYEYEVTDISERGNDFKTWEYKIRNSRTGFEFKYVFKITETALNCDPRSLMSPIYEMVTSKGEDVVKKWLDRGVEFDLGAFIDERKFYLF